MPLPRMWVEVRQKFLVNACLLGFLVLITVAITALYVSSERNFHWWIDWYSSAIRVTTAFRESPWKGLQLVQNSLVQDRNWIYTLPLVPFLLTFGTSRLVYELALALVYLLPFAIAMGGICSKLVRVQQQTVFWAAALLTLLIPVSWIPTFMGIPDTGGAFLIALASLVYLQDVKLRRWWQIPLVGLLLGFAVLLRRHFVYGCIAFLGAITVQALIRFSVEVRKKPQLAWRNLIEYGVRIGLISAIAISTVMAVAWQFTYRARMSDYGTLYKSWNLPLGEITSLYASYYGWGTWLLVAIGFSASILTCAVALPAISFMALSGVFSLIAWLVVLRYANVFYSVHITPLVIVGLFALIWTTWISVKGKLRTLILGVVGCYLVSNLVISLAPVGNLSQFFHPLFAVNMPPLVRTDYDEVVRLVKYLRQLTPKKEPIFVVGNQRLQLDSSLVRGVEILLYGHDGRILRLLPVPKVDSRDTYPLESLLKAQYVVVPNSLPSYPSGGVLQDTNKFPVVGEWLTDKELDVVTVVFDAFTQNQEIAQDFRRLPVQFTLEQGTVVSIYQRIRPTSLDTAVRTLNTIVQRTGERPGGQVDWLVVNPHSNYSVVKKNLNNTYKLVSRPSDRLLKSVSKELGQLQRDRTEGRGTSFLYLGSLPENAQVTGGVISLSEPCVSSSIRLSTLNKDGQILSSSAAKYVPNDLRKFAVSISGKNSSYLLLDILSYDKKNLVDFCNIEINSLTVFNSKQ